jgi:hypothetical protein
MISTIAGGVSAVLVYVAGVALIERRRRRARRTALRQRLFK